MGKRLAQAAAERALRSGDRTGLHLRLARYLAKRLTRHYAGGSIPLIGAPIGAVQNAAATKRLGQRALAYYGGRSGAAVDRARRRRSRVADSSETRKRTTLAIVARVDPLRVVGVGLGGAVGGRVDHARQDRVGAHPVALYSASSACTKASSAALPAM